MSLGATMSAPARTCDTAVCAISSTVLSLSTTSVAAGVGPQQAAMTVVGVLAQADVGDHQQLRMRLLDRPRRELDDALVVVGTAADGVLLGRDAEQQHRRQAEGRGFAGLAHGLADRQPVDAGHRRDRRARGAGIGSGGTGLDEQRQHEVCGLEPRLAHEVAQRRGAAQASHARQGKGHARRVSPPSFQHERRTAPDRRGSRRRSRLVGRGRVRFRRHRDRQRAARPPGLEGQVRAQVGGVSRRIAATGSATSAPMMP